MLVLSAYNDDDTVRELMRAGAAGYLTKHTAAQEAGAGDSRGEARELVFQRRDCQADAPPNPERLSKWGERPGKYGALTPRETEVLKLIAEGRANKQIGVDLSISIKTVEKHRQTLMEKLDIHDTAGLTRYAFAKGVLGSNELNPAR